LNSNPGRGSIDRALGKTLSRLRAFLLEGHPLVQLRILLLLAIGWMLSPLCWWNDLVINLPLAYGFAAVVKLWRPDWFLPALVVGYWLSNVVGLLLLQSTALAVFQEADRERRPVRELLVGLGSSTAITVLMVVLVQLGILHAPLPELTGG
jgi:hypothetical protein